MIAALMVLVVGALVIYLEMGRSTKLALTGVAGLWIGLTAAASAAGWFGIGRPFPIIGVFVAMPLVGAAIATVWPTVRVALLELPTRLIIGLNIGRVLGALFLLLAMQGQLAGPFPFFAGWGDIIIGVFAALLVFAVVDGKYRGALEAWNLGAGDLVLALFLGVTSAIGAPLQLFHSLPGSEAMQHLPWSFIPTVLVPLYLIIHAVIGSQLRARRASARAGVQTFHAS
jgi:hypothetical protein